MKIILAAALLVLSSTAPAQAPVRVAEVRTGPVSQQLAATGTVSSPRSAVLSTAVAGLVDELYVDEGDEVTRGSALLQLDAEIAELTLARLQAVIQQRTSALQDAQRRLAEAENIGPDRGIAQTSIDSLRSEVQVAQATLAAAEAEANEQNARVARHRLVAPFDGVITQRITEMGEWVNPGSGLLELIATTGLRFEFRVAQRFLGDIARDTPVVVSFEARPQQDLPARVDAIVPVSDPASRTFLVRLVAEDPGGEAVAAPGMSVSAVFSMQTGRRGKAVSRDALLRYEDGRTTVWVVEQNDAQPVVVERTVRTGLEFDGLVEITSGLEAGERVVVEGNESLREGQAIRILDQGV